VSVNRRTPIMSRRRWIAAVTTLLASVALLGCGRDPVRATYSASTPAPVASTSLAPSATASSVVAPVVTPVIGPIAAAQQTPPPRSESSVSAPPKKPRTAIAKQSLEPTYVWRKRCRYVNPFPPSEPGYAPPEEVCDMERVKVSSRKSRNPTVLAAPPPTTSGRTIRSKL
jgi:hypothetical protein